MSRSADFKKRQSEKAFAEHAAPVLENPERYTPLKVARINAGLTQAQLANLARVSVGPITAAENGGQKIHKNTKRKIQDALKEELFDD